MRLARRYHPATAVTAAAAATTAVGKVVAPAAASTPQVKVCGGGVNSPG